MKFLAVLIALVAACLAQTPSKGAAFDHIFILWLEEYDPTQFRTAFASYIPNGITLTNYHGLTLGTQPNHVAAIGGDYFGMNGDNDELIFNIPASYKTVVDLLEAQGRTWKTYLEDLPSPCFTGANYANYYRRYDGFASFQSISTNATRCANLVPATQLQTDLQNDALPSFSWYTPNYLNNGDGSNFTYASDWLNNFLPPLLNNTKFLNRTLFFLAFDDGFQDDLNEGTLNDQFNALILGDAIPASLKGTTDNTFYTHYSILSTVEANWKLGNLGRNDIDPVVSNVFDFVATATGYKEDNVSQSNEPNLTAQETGFLNNQTTSAASNTVLPGLAAAVAGVVVLAINFL